MNALSLVWTEFHLDCSLDTGRLVGCSDRATGMTGTFLLGGTKNSLQEIPWRDFFLFLDGWNTQDEKTQHLMFPLFGNDTKQHFPGAKLAV